MNVGAALQLAPQNWVARRSYLRVISRITSYPLRWIAIVEVTVGLAAADRVEIVFYLRMISAMANASSSGQTSRGHKVLLSNLIMT